MLEAVVKAKFRKGRGKRLVEKDQWKLLDLRNTRHSINAITWEFIPGMRVTMAMIIPQIDKDMRCPCPGCPSTSYLKTVGGVIPGG
jgi:hypothetical protein